MIIVQYSTGAGSAEVAARCVDAVGTAGVHLLSADTTVEDPDNWRFADEVWRWLGEPAWTVVRDGRSPMQVGMDRRVVPNNRMAVCSEILKREALRWWLERNSDPVADVIAIGYDWTEQPRLDASLPHWAPWPLICPLVEPPLIEKAAILDGWRARGIDRRRPRPRAFDPPRPPRRHPQAAPAPRVPPAPRADAGAVRGGRLGRLWVLHERRPTAGPEPRPPEPSGPRGGGVGGGARPVRVVRPSGWWQGLPCRP